MKKILILLPVFIVILISLILININTKNSKKTKQTKTTKLTIKGDENIMDGITLNYHSSLRFVKEGKIIYFDPFKIDENIHDADYVFITHNHYDHFSKDDIKKVMKEGTKFVITSDIKNEVSNLGVNASNILDVLPGKDYEIDGISFSTVAAYNINKPFHKKEYNWVGYNITLDGTRYYIVGDSDITDELKSVNCDVIFIPVGGTYTSTSKEASNAVNNMEVKIAIPYHYGVVGSRKDAENFINDLNDNIKGVILK